MIKKMKVEKHISDDVFEDWDDVIIEEILHVEIENRQIQIMCSPEHMELLALGYLKNAGFINDSSDIKVFEVIESKIIVKLKNKGDLEVSEKINSGCLGKTLEMKEKHIKKRVKKNRIESKFVFEYSNKLNDFSNVFKLTGGVHSSLAILSNDKEIFFEDIGRHNTVDKITGYCIANKETLLDAILITTGRISSEMLQKAALNGVKTMISRSAPTTQAVTAANEFNIELIGFARGRKFNRY